MVMMILLLAIATSFHLAEKSGITNYGRLVLTLHYYGGNDIMSVFLASESTQGKRHNTAGNWEE